MACETSIKEKLGLVQVYTGNGKGKTTAALGLSFRAAGRGLRVAMVQFMKPEEGYGEQVSAGSLENFEIYPMGMSPLVGREPAPEDIRAAEEALSKARELMYSGCYDLIVMDEVNVAMGWGILRTEDVLEMLGGRPENVEVVLTGRYAPDKVIEYADLVTEMVCVKHPFDKGIGARKGIES
ncbi:MAG: cob(I)yrinic acid a,c-diamide adenosyltransferase [Candidatus Methanomethylophilaceae archaeon]|nr:cob(I)yrinic acid a,c-diamide adenosyltransferase [Candidatus Methanomethylophilaceae archaeon]